MHALRTSSQTHPSEQRARAAYSEVLALKYWRVLLADWPESDSGAPSFQGHRR